MKRRKETTTMTKHLPGGEKVLIPNDAPTPDPVADAELAKAKILGSERDHVGAETLRKEFAKFGDLDEQSADAFDHLMAQGKIDVLVGANEFVPGAIFPSYSDPSATPNHPPCRSTTRARLEAEAQFGTPEIGPEDVVFDPKIVQAPDPACDCGSQKAGGRCDPPCPAAVPFHKMFECLDHRVLLEDLLECGACEKSAYCPGCRMCLKCLEPNDDGDHEAPWCDKCRERATFAVLPEVDDAERVYRCDDHVADALSSEYLNHVEPIDVIRCTARALREDCEELPF